MSGLFISIEGGEGVGKTVFCQRLMDQLRQDGVDAVFTREPGGTAVSQKIREIFMNPPEGESLEALAELYLISAARVQHVARLIGPALDQGRVVVCDRFYDSTRVYQGELGGVSQELLEPILTQSTGGYEPLITLLLDCDVEIAQKRLASRFTEESGNRYDDASLDFHKKLRQSYLTVAQRFPERIQVQDASKAADEVFAGAYGVLKAYFDR